MLEERVVVDRELGVERLHLAVGSDDQRIDLTEHRVGPDEGRIQPLGDLGDLLLLTLVLDPGAVDQAASLVRLEALERVDVELRQRLGPLLGDLLDVDSALLREHEQGLLLAPVEGKGEVVLALDVGRGLDPHLPHDVAVDVHPEDRLCVGRGLVGPVGELDPARLASAARQYLRLDDGLAPELLGRLAGLLRRGREPPLGDGNAETLEELLALVLVEIHDRGASLSIGH